MARLFAALKEGVADVTETGVSHLELLCTLVLKGPSRPFPSSSCISGRIRQCVPLTEVTRSAAFVGEAKDLQRRLQELDVSVGSLKTKMDKMESVQTDAVVGVERLLVDLSLAQETWESDQAELLELEEAAAALKDDQRSMPELLQRKETVMTRLNTLKFAISVSSHGLTCM